MVMGGGWWVVWEGGGWSGGGVGDYWGARWGKGQMLPAEGHLSV